MRHKRRLNSTAVTSLLVTLAVVIGAGMGPVRAQQYTPQYTAPSGPIIASPPPAGVAAPPPPVSPLLIPPPAPPPAPPTFASGLQLIAHPYLWLAGVNVGLTTPIARVPQVNASAGAFQVLSDLNAVPFMGAAELRDGPFGVLADGLHLPLGVGITTRNILFSGGHTSMVADIVTADFLYRVLDQPNQRIDGGLGFRFWGMSTDTILNGALLPTQRVSDSGSWTDPLIAARYHRDFGNGFGLTVYGDVGGFGIAAHADWQIIGTLDYALKPWLDMQIGYRSLNVNYTASAKPIGFNAHMKGPLLAATIHF
jgi:hypothetical protein